MVDSLAKPGYKSNRLIQKDKLSKAQFYTQSSPTGKEPIKYKLVFIPAEKVSSVVRKSKLNKRSEKHLNTRAISDILPDIEKAKRNDHPCKAYGTIDDMVVMEGLRRTYAVRQVEGAELAVWLTEYVHPEDEAVIVSRADKYREPTTIDLALTIKELIDSSEKDYSVRDLADIFDISRGTAQNAKELMTIPEGYFSKYPSLHDVSLRLALRFSAFIKQLPEDEVTAILEALPKVSADNDEEAKVAVKQLEDEIKSVLSGQDKQAKNAELQTDVFNGLKLKKGVVASLSNKGVLSLKIPPTIDESIKSKIAKLLAE